MASASATAVSRSICKVEVDDRESDREEPERGENARGGEDDEDGPEAPAPGHRDRVPCRSHLPMTPSVWSRAPDAPRWSWEREASAAGIESPRSPPVLSTPPTIRVLGRSRENATGGVRNVYGHSLWRPRSNPVVLTTIVRGERGSAERGRARSTPSRCNGRIRQRVRRAARYGRARPGRGPTDRASPRMWSRVQNGSSGPLAANPAVTESWLRRARDRRRVETGFGRSGRCRGRPSFRAVPMEAAWGSMPRLHGPTRHVRSRAYQRCSRPVLAHRGVVAPVLERLRCTVWSQADRSRTGAAVWPRDHFGVPRAGPHFPGLRWPGCSLPPPLETIRRAPCFVLPGFRADSGD